MAQKLSFVQSVLLAVPSRELVVFIVPSACFMWNKALLKVACVKSAGICFTLWRRHRKRHLELKVEITYSISDTESKYKLKPCLPLHCISSVCALVLAATAVFLTNFIVYFSLLLLLGVMWGLLQHQDATAVSGKTLSIKQPLKGDFKPKGIHLVECLLLN